MRATHDCPTRYYVGRASCGNLIFADFEEGRSKPRYLMFTSEFEARADAARRHATLSVRGISFHYDLKNAPPEDYPARVWEEENECVMSLSTL